MARIILSALLIFQTISLSGQKSFSFVYLPDIHLQKDSITIASFRFLTRQINRIDPDFILTGGDMIFTAKNVNDRKAGELFDLMDREFKRFKMPVHLTMGNHENVGITQESGIDKTNPMWGKQMYESRYGRRYGTFTCYGWKFFILDGIQILEQEKNYTQGADSSEIEWIRNELDSTEKDVPIIISIHPPLINPHGIISSGSEVLTANSSAVLDLFRNHNLKIVLEGHTHLYMNLLLNGVHYISGGSTAVGTSKEDDGFALVKITNDTECIQFIKTIKQGN